MGIGVILIKGCGLRDHKGALKRLYLNEVSVKVLLIFAKAGLF
jgi:hypothetical protein